MSRQGLVKKQVQVTKNGKTFTQTVWVKASQDPKGSDGLTNLDPDKAKEFQSLQELFKTDKASGLEKLKTMGVTWEENPHPAVNLMRAKVAMKQYFGISASKPGGTQQDQPSKNNQDLISKLKSMGVSWKENQHPAINLMRAKMAAKDAGVDLNNLPNSESEIVKKDNSELKNQYRKTRAKDRAEFKKKIEVLSEDLTESQSKAVRTVGIMPTDEASKDYIENFLTKRYLDRMADAFPDASYSKKPRFKELIYDFERVGDKNLFKNISSINPHMKGIEQLMNEPTERGLRMSEVIVLSEGLFVPDPKNSRLFNHDMSKEGNQKVWNARLEKITNRAKLLKDPTKTLDTLEKFAGVLEDTKCEPLLMEALWRAVRDSYRDTPSSSDQDLEDYRDSRDRVLHFLPNDTPDELKEELKNSDELYKALPVLRAMLEDPAIRSALMSSVSLDYVVSSNMRTNSKYRDGSITTEDVVRSTNFVMEGVDFVNVSDKEATNEQLVSNLGGYLRCLDSVVVQVTPSTYERDNMWDKYDTLQKAVANSVTRDFQDNDFSGCNSIIKTVDPETFKSVVSSIAKDFDNKHKNQGYNILNVFEIVDLPNIDENYDKLNSERGNEKKRLYHGTGSFATAAIVGKSGEFKIVEAKVGRMLGDGIYLTDKTSKASLYISDEGYGKTGDQGTLMICDAILGLTSSYEDEPDINTVAALTTSKDWKHLRNNEWCVRDPKAVRPRYMVHMEVSNDD